MVITISAAQANHGSDNNYNRGGGIKMEGAVNTIDIRNCTIKDNLASFAAGIMAEFSSSATHSANLENCIFRNNISRYGSAFLVAFVAGDGTATVSNCLITGNEAIDHGPGPGFSGPGGFLDSRAGSTLNAEVINCTFTDNLSAGTNGGLSESSTLAVRRYAGTLNFTMANSVFDNNTASKSVGRLNSSNCPTTALLVNNIRPDVAATVCSTSSLNESSLAPTLDADGRPMPGSNTINAGDNTYSHGTLDIDGNNRVLAGTIDIGAFEFDPAGCSPITQQPISAISSCSGEATTIEVTASEAGASYQWNYNGSPISGAISSSFTIANTQAADAGNYTVDVTVDCGSVTSQATTVTVSSGPTITQQPVDLNGCFGDQVTLSVVATGTNLTYEWQADEDPSAFQGINGGATVGLGVNNFTTSAIFRVIVSDASGCDMISDEVNVIETPIPTITQHPTDQLDCLGGSVTFTSGASGATLTQWYKNGTPIPGELSPTLTISNLIAGDVGTYTMIASNACGSLYSDNVQLNIGGTTALWFCNLYLRINAKEPLLNSFLRQLAQTSVTNGDWMGLI